MEKNRLDLARARVRRDQVGEGGIAHVEPAGKGAERGHHQARCVRCKAAPADGAPAMRDTRHWMQMAGNFAGGAGRQMAERQAADGHRRLEHAADRRRRLGIVIAGDPDPVAAALQGA